MLADEYMMWLSEVKGLSYRAVRALLDAFENPLHVWNANKEHLAAVKGISKETACKIIASKKSFSIKERERAMKKLNISYLSMQNPFYPALLKEAPDCPLGIYVRGTIPDDNIEKISVVGARRCTQYGHNAAVRLAKDLSNANVTVVSGMAIGIDSAAHRGALEGAGQTIAVLGCGVDICYPAENRSLMNQIIDRGCVMSEFVPGARAYPASFPQRNRIIAGLSRATVVVEAGQRSGSMITVDKALDYGRDVFVVPGNITSDLSVGTNNLIKQGCPIVTNYEDILTELRIAYSEKEKEVFIKKIADGLESDEKRVYDCINLEPISTEEVIIKSGMPPQNVQYILTMLELKGHIKKLPGFGYIREA